MDNDSPDNIGAIGITKHLYNSTIQHKSQKREIKMNLWSTKIEVVDYETGEIIPKKKVQNGEFIVLAKILKNTKHYENGKHIREYQWICQRNTQLQIGY